MKYVIGIYSEVKETGQAMYV